MLLKELQVLEQQGASVLPMPKVQQEGRGDAFGLSQNVT